MNQFLGLMTDPFIAGRGNPEFGRRRRDGIRRRATACLCGQAAIRTMRWPRSIARLPVAADPFAQRWSVWAAVDGGSETTNGNAVLGSNNTSSNLLWHGRRRRLPVIAVHAGRICARRRRHQLQPRQRARLRAGLILFQAGAFVRHNMGDGLSLGCAGLWLAGHHHQSHADDCWRRPVAGRSSTPTPGRAASRAATGSWRRGPGDRADAVCGRPVHHFRSARLCRTSGRRRQYLRTGLRRQERDRQRAANLACAPINRLRWKDGVFTLRGRAAWAHDYNPDRSYRRHLPDAAGRLTLSSTARGQASDAVLLDGFRREEMAERLVGRRSPSRASSPASPPAMPARVWCDTLGNQRRPYLARTGPAGAV